jgi:tetratricopeptide (TPR) repeat protein
MDDLRSVAVSVLFIGTLGSLSYSQDLPISRRVFIISPTVMEMATKVSPNHVDGAVGTVLLIFRTSEQGTVIDLQSIGGSSEMQRSSQDALSKWKFKPMLNDRGQPMEMFSAVLFDFTGVRPNVVTPLPMTPSQLSRVGYPCLNAIAHQAPDAVSLCKKQLDLIVKDPKSSKMEQFTAYDEYGVALLYAAPRHDSALQQFTNAIEIASNCLRHSDAEWAYAYWHRGVAASQSGNQEQAKQDFAVANESLKQAEAAMGTKDSAYYRQLEERLERLANRAQ